MLRWNEQTVSLHFKAPEHSGRCWEYWSRQSWQGFCRVAAAFSAHRVNFAALRTRRNQPLCVVMLFSHAHLVQTDWIISIKLGTRSSSRAACTSYLREYLFIPGEEMLIHTSSRSPHALPPSKIWRDVFWYSTLTEWEFLSSGDGEETRGGTVAHQTHLKDQQNYFSSPSLPPFFFFNSQPLRRQTVHSVAFRHIRWTVWDLTAGLYDVKSGFVVCFFLKKTLVASHHKDPISKAVVLNKIRSYDAVSRSSVFTCYEK